MIYLKYNRSESKLIFSRYSAELDPKICPFFSYFKQNKGPSDKSHNIQISLRELFARHVPNIQENFNALQSLINSNAVNSILAREENASSMLLPPFDSQQDNKTGHGAYNLNQSFGNKNPENVSLNNYNLPDCDPVPRGLSELFWNFTCAKFLVVRLL